MPHSITPTPTSTITITTSIITTIIIAIGYVEQDVVVRAPLVLVVVTTRAVCEDTTSPFRPLLALVLSRTRITVVAWLLLSSESGSTSCVSTVLLLPLLLLLLLLVLQSVGLTGLIDLARSYWTRPITLIDRGEWNNGG